MVRFIQLHAPWLAGFLLTANLYLVPTMASSPRATDILGLVFGLWILIRLVHGRQPAGPLVVASLVGLMPLGWFFFGVINGDMATASQTARWLLAVPWAIALPALLDDSDRRRRFAWGVLWGCWVGVAVIVLQWMGFESLLRMVGLSSSDSAYYHYVFYSVRIPGLHGQHNASATIISLAIPAVFFLYFRRKCSLAVVMGTLLGFLVALHLTSTRSPLIVAIPAVVYAFVAAHEAGRGVILGAVLLAVVVPLVAVVGPPGGWSRWSDTEAIHANAGERANSTLGAMELAIGNPAGFGVTRGKEQLADATGSLATHNAFLQASVHLGMPLALAVLAGMIAVILRGLGGPDGPLFLEGLLAFQTAGVFMFEEHLNNPSFVILACWFVVAAATNRSESRTTTS